MKEEIYTIENGDLVCNYTTWGGKLGRKTFKRFVTANMSSIKSYKFFIPNTKYFVELVWCNLTTSYTALYNNTKFSFFIRMEEGLFDNLTIHERPKQI